MEDHCCCGTCVFYMTSPKVCRRYPPTPIMVGVRQGLAAVSQQEPLVMAFFPSMNSTGWCGEYQQVRQEEKDN